MKWNDFNDDELESKNFELIPKGTIAKVMMTIEPGKYNDETRNWTGGYATHNPKTGSVYLYLKFVVVEGIYTHRQVRGMIGLHSEKGEDWGRMGRSFVKAILSSSIGVSLYDKSESAKNLRKINSFSDLDGLEFLARIDIELDKNGVECNVIKQAITCDHKDYTALMGQPKTSSPAAKISAHTPARNISPASKLLYHQNAISRAQEDNTPPWMR